MARELPEWIGRDNDRIPDRVRLRIFEKYGGKCMCGCLRKIYIGDEWDCDHIVALINGGENRENNLRPLLRACHKGKTAEDVEEKSKIARIRSKHLGIKPKRKWRWG